MAEKSAREKARDKATKNSKDRSTARIWGVIGGVAVGVAAAGFAIYTVAGNDQDAAPTPTEEVSVAPGTEIPSTATSSGAFQIPGTGNESDTAIRVDYYFDPACPACQMFDEQVGDTVAEYVENGDIDLHIHPVSFLGDRSENDYSGLAANAIVAVHEHEPEHTLAFKTAIYDSDFFPQGGTDTRTAEELADLATEIGVSEEVSEGFSDRVYQTWVTDNTDTQINRPDFFPTGDFGTPAVFIGAEEEQEDGTVAGNVTRVDLQSGDGMKDAFVTAIENAKE